MSFTFSERSSVSFSDCLILEIARKAGHLPLGILIGVLQNSAEHKNFETDKLYQSNSSREAHRILIQELEHFGGGPTRMECRGIYRPATHETKNLFFCRNHLVPSRPLSFIMSSSHFPQSLAGLNDAVCEVLAPSTYS